MEMSNSYNCLGFHVFGGEKGGRVLKSRLAAVLVTGGLFEWFEEGRMQGQLEIAFCPIQTMAPVAGSQVTYSDALERTTPKKTRGSEDTKSPPPPQSPPYSFGVLFMN